MATKVSPFNPMFSLQRSQLHIEHDQAYLVEEFYSIADDGSAHWVSDQKRALLFMSLHSADLVQKAEGGNIVAISNQAIYEDYRS